MGEKGQTKGRHPLRGDTEAKSWRKMSRIKGPLAKGIPRGSGTDVRTGEQPIKSRLRAVLPTLRRKSPQRDEIEEGLFYSYDNRTKEIAQPLWGTNPSCSRFSFFQLDYNLGPFLLLDFAVAAKELLRLTSWKSLTCLNSFSVPRLELD